MQPGWNARLKATVCENMFRTDPEKRASSTVGWLVRVVLVDFDLL